MRTELLIRIKVKSSYYVECNRPIVAYNMLQTVRTELLINTSAVHATREEGRTEILPRARQKDLRLKVPRHLRSLRMWGAKEAKARHII